METNSNISSSGSSCQPSFVRPPSFIGLFFDTQSTNVPGKYKCICKICDLMGEESKEYGWGSGEGPELMARHLRKKHSIKKDGISQTQPGEDMSESPGRGTPFVYDPERMIDGFVTFVIRDGLPFYFGESLNLETFIKLYLQPAYMSELPDRGTPFIYNRERMMYGLATYVSLEGLPLNFSESRNLETFIKLYLQPAYRRVSRKTLIRRSIIQYYLSREDLIRYFADYVGRVSLTCDMWRSEQCETYLCIGVHWIDENSLLQRLIIAFDGMAEFRIGHEEVNTRICLALDEFNLRGKVFSISFDDATANTKCIDRIEKNHSVLLDDVLLHVRCCAHIINLSAQEGISFLSRLLTPVRDVIKWIRCASSTSLTMQKYMSMCQEKGLKPVHFYPEHFYRDNIIPVWNSTYKMLDHALAYKDILTVLYNESHANSETFIDDSSWQIAEQISKLLKAYYNASKVFSLVYDANVHSVIMECAKIVKAMSDCERSNSCLQPIVVEMRRKWLSYFHEFPVIYGVACLLDPDIKLCGLTKMLDFYYQTLAVEYDVKQYVDRCVVALNKLYDIYAQESGSNGETSKKRRFDDEFASILFRNSANIFNTSFENEIHYYFSFSNATTYSDFNILSWWHNHSSRFPILSKLARDLLVVPASTFVSESTFGAGGEVIDEKRSSMMPEFVKMFVCKKDWDQSKRRQQRIKEDYDNYEDDLIMTSLEGMSLSDSEEGDEDDKLD